MHFSIPCTRELKDESGSNYTAFDVHVNGVLHCTVRYSQLFDLNEKLKQEFGTNHLPVFPPKKLFAVKGINLEERKKQLEKYVQNLCQDQGITNCETFATFLSRAQQETQLEESSSVNFEVYLMNGAKMKINIQSTDKTDLVLEHSVAALGLKEELTYYFGLFLVKSNEEGNFSLVRQLQEFECPYLSLKSVNLSSFYKIVLRKTYWDQSFDNDVLVQNIGLNLLHVQAESDTKMGWTRCTEEERKRLKDLKGKGSKREFVHFCQTLSRYGYIQLDPCFTDYPKEKTPVVISIGNYEVVFETKTGDKNRTKTHFLVTRIKGWKVSSLVCMEESEKSETFLLSFEYLVSKGNLQWIRVVTNQAIIMSMSIKSMVDELLRKRGGRKFKKPSDRRASGAKPTFKPRDRTTETLFNQSEVDVTGVDASGMQKAKDSVKKISGLLSAKSSGTSQDEAKVENNFQVKQTFEKIGDDEL